MRTITIHPDQRAAEMIRNQHAVLVDRLRDLIGCLREADDAHFEKRRADLLDWLHSELVSQAVGEEATFYRAAAVTESGRLLVGAMVSEHSVIRDFVQQIDTTADRGEVVGWASALLRVLISHVALENDFILPLLVEDPGVDLAALVGELHDH